MTKQDFEIIQNCGHPDPKSEIDPTGKRDMVYRKAVALAFFPTPQASSVGKIDVDAEWFAAPDHKEKWVPFD